MVSTPETFEKLKVKETKGDLTLYLDEYATKEKSQKAFDNNLPKYDVLPLLISLENTGEVSYEIKSGDIQVQEENTLLKRLTAEEAAGKVKKSAVGRALGWSLIVPIIGIPIAAAVSVSNTNKVNKQILKDFQTKSFQNGEIKPNQKTSGFIFYELPKKRKNLDGIRLTIKAKNMATEQVLNIETPLPATKLTR